MSENKQLTCDRLKEPYSRVLIPAEDGTYFAQILEFPGCYAEGKTAEEAIQNVENAAASWIEAAQAQGQDIPEPLANYGYSGKINLRLPRSIHKRAARFAQKDDISLNQFFTSAIAARVGAEEFCDNLVKRLEARLTQQTPIVNLMAAQTQYILRSPQDILSVSYFVKISQNVPMESSRIPDNTYWKCLSSTAPHTYLEHVDTNG